METLTEFCRRIIAACETEALEAIQSDDDCKADTFLRLAEAYTDVVAALESDDAERIMEIVQ